jgi:transposase
MSEPAAASTPPCRSTRSRAVTREVWIDRLTRFPLSGLTPAQFCALEAISLPSFYAWKRRLAAESHFHETASREDPGPRLLSVRLPQPTAPLELVLPSGALLRISAGCDLALVRSLVQALGGAPC